MSAAYVKTVSHIHIHTRACARNRGTSWHEHKHTETHTYHAPCQKYLWDIMSLSADRTVDHSGMAAQWLWCKSQRTVTLKTTPILQLYENMTEVFCSLISQLMLSLTCHSIIQDTEYMFVYFFCYIYCLCNIHIISTKVILVCKNILLHFIQCML